MTVSYLSGVHCSLTTTMTGVSPALVQKKQVDQDQREQRQVVASRPAAGTLTASGGLSFMASGTSLQQSVRQMRGTAPAQIPGTKISVCHGIGGMFAASGTIIMSNEPP